MEITHAQLFILLVVMDLAVARKMSGMQDHAYGFGKPDTEQNDEENWNFCLEVCWW